MSAPRNRWLRRRLHYVRVHSCSDGSFTIEARWNEPYARRAKTDPPGPLDFEQPPGLFTRMETAEEIECVLNRALGYGVRTASTRSGSRDASV